MIVRYKLYLEDIASFAFIKAFDENETRFLSYQEIEDFGRRVVEKIKEQSGNNAKLCLSRAETENFYAWHSEFFKEKTEGGEDGIFLKHGKTRNDLIGRFVGCMPVDVLKAMAATALRKEESK